ncbi:MAG: T9SS type A sorting domain-containing protein [Cytophagaceae bacterium]|nr:T9SS type A sorting domain-containing protein [Cytophagaceae bacterium]MDW8456660.1 T9SS type A sorting domain-containing protein [Cytophagaceae bacterium]
MKKRAILLHIASACLLIFVCISVKSQIIKDCPSYPATSYFDSLCFNPIGNNQILLGQGRVRHQDLWGSFYRADIYIPVNRPLWAIAQVHGWHLIRNILKYEPYDKHMFAATMMKESYMGCDGGISFAGLPPPFQYDITTTPNFQPGNAMNIRDGCFHIDKTDGTQGVLMKYYPHRFYDLDYHHGNYIGGTNYERAIISKVMYDVILYRLREYSDGLDPQGVLNNAADPFAGEIYTAIGYNRGFNDSRLITVLDNPGRRATAIASANWLTLNVGSGSLGYDYTRATSQVVRVLSNNNYTGTPVPKPDPSFADSDNQWHSWYDYHYSWAQVETYLDKILFMYPEANAALVKSKVKFAFDQQKDASGRVSFRYRFGPVLDAIVLALPYDDPMPVILSSTATMDQCAGKVGPVVKITPSLPTTVCNGQSVQLSTIAGSGYTYQWKRNGVNIPNSNTPPHIFYATTSGSYSVVVTTSSGAVIPSECAIDVTVNNCSSCSMTAQATITNNSCTGRDDGSVAISLTNASGHLPAQINWTGPVSGNATLSSTTHHLSNLREGTYQIEIVSIANPTCRAFATARLREAIRLNQSLSIQSTPSSCNSAQLTGIITNNPLPECDYRLQLFENSGSPWWDHSILRIDVSANGNSLGMIRPRKRVWNDPVWLDTLLTIPHNATIRVSINNITTTTQTGPNFSLRMFHPNGTVAFTENLSGRTFPTNMTTLRTLTANCQEAMPAYTYSWTPTAGLSSTNTAATTAAVSANTTYTLRAYHPDPTKAGCFLSASVLVENKCTPLSVSQFILTANSQHNMLEWYWAEDAEKILYYEILKSDDGSTFSTVAISVQNTAVVSASAYYQVRAVTEHYRHIYSNIVNVEGNEWDVRISPNPSSEKFTVYFNQVTPACAEIYDICGNTINIMKNLQSGDDLGEDWKPGLYFIKIHSANHQTVIRKIIKH